MGDTLENPIENVAMIVLRAVVEKDLETKTKGNYNGPDLKELTGLSHEWINDAISFLENNGLIKHFGALGTAPYKFAWIEITTDGKYEYYELVSKGTFDKPSLSVTNQRLIFISYSSEDKKLAGRVKELLIKNGFLGFLAHEDIESDRWLPIVEQNLRACSCLIPIVSDNFDKRWWTNQEVGYVIGAGKKVFPLFLKHVDRNTMGFLTEYQGEIGINLENFDSKARSLIERIKSELRI